MSATATRAAFGEAIVSLADRYPNLVVVDADLSKSTMTGAFAKKCPERYFDIGIAEGNLVGIGAGLALGGKIPFICSFACFLTGRFEQIRLSIAYTETNVRLIGTHAGIGIGEDGYSQMALEDVSVIRSLSNIAIIQPADRLETIQAIEYSMEHNGPIYFRLTRHKLSDVHNADYKFQFGKGDVLQEGDDLLMLATGGLVAPTLEAASMLSDEGINATVVNVHSIRALDDELILDLAASSRKVVTLEDHSVRGGLGGAVAELLCEKLPVPLHRIGMHGFGESGTQGDLYEKYGFTGHGIKTSVLKFIEERREKDVTPSSVEVA